MTDQQYPSGWFPDPLGRYEHRWFNGTSWTSDVATNGQRFVDPLGIAPGPGSFGAVGGADGRGGTRAATAALVCGLIGMAIAWIPLLVVVGFVLAVVAVVFGVRGLRKSRTTGAGRGRAVTGIVTGVLALGLSVVGVILTIDVFREVIAFVEPGPRIIEDVACAAEDGGIAVTGRLTNLDDRERDYVVFVTVGDRTRYAELDDVDADATVDWIVRFDRALDTGTDCAPDVVVNGPFPYGVETDPYRD